MTVSPHLRAVPELWAWWGSRVRLTLGAQVLGSKIPWVSYSRAIPWSPMKAGQRGACFFL